jgi:uncharacterized protein YukE
MSSSIPGDPAGMRAKAARLRSQADQVLTWVGQIDRKVDGMEFEGPAAKHIHTQMHTWSTDMKQAGHELHDLADLLQRSAGDVETRQAAEARRQAAQEAEEERRKREAAAGGGGR